MYLVGTWPGPPGVLKGSQVFYGVGKIEDYFVVVNYIGAIFRLSLSIPGSATHQMCDRRQVS